MKKIIILDKIVDSSDTGYNYIFWAEVPLNRRGIYANKDLVSQYKNATAEENTALANGEITEQKSSIYLPKGVSIDTIKEELVQRFNKFQESVNNKSDYSVYGTFYEDSTWNDILIN